MKKRFLLLLLGFVLFPSIIVRASENYYIKNNKGVKITEEEYQKLIDIDFTEQEIMDMKKNDLDILTNYDNGNVKKEIKYVKDIYIYEKKRNHAESPKLLKIQSFEVDKEEYDNATPENVNNSQNKNENYRDPILQDGATYETTYKKIVLVISYRTDTPTVRSISAKLTWKIMPSVRSWDIIAIRTTGGLLTANTQSGTVNYSYKDTPYCDGTFYTYSNTVSYANGNTAWHKASAGFGYSGVGLTVGLPTDSITCYNDLGMPYYITLTAHSTYIVTSATTSNQITAYATYQHATSYVTFGNVYNTYSFSSSGLGGVIYFSNGMGSYYDGMGGVSLTF